MVTAATVMATFVLAAASAGYGLDGVTPSEGTPPWVDAVNRAYRNMGRTAFAAAHVLLVAALLALAFESLRTAGRVTALGGLAGASAILAAAIAPWGVRPKRPSGKRVADYEPRRAARVALLLYVAGCAMFTVAAAVVWVVGGVQR